MILFIVLAILCIGFIIGYLMGVVRIALSLGITIISLILVSILAPTITNLVINHTEIDDRMSEKLVNAFAQHGEEYLDQNIAEIPLVQQVSMIETSYLPEFLQKSLIQDNNNEVYNQMGVNTFLDYVGAYIARWIIKAVIFMIVFILILVAMKIVVLVLNVVTMLPIIHGANKLVGGIIGLISALFIIWSMFLIVDVMYQKEWAQNSKQEIEENILLNTIYSSNLLIKVIGS